MNQAPACYEAIVDDCRGVPDTNDWAAGLIGSCPKSDSKPS
jgi:hypothetical protein